MKNKHVYVYESVWENGVQFEGGVSIRLFSDKDKALAALKSDIEEVKTTFLDKYDNDDILVDGCEFVGVEVHDTEYADCWTGMVYQKGIE